MVSPKNFIPWNKGKVNVYSIGTLKKMSDAKKGKELSLEHKFKIGQSMIGKKRKPFSDVTKEKMSIARKGKVIPVEVRQKISKSCKGRCLTQKTKNKISKAHKGKPTWIKGKKMPPRSKEWCDNIGKGNKGKTVSAETIRKILHRRIPTSLEKKFQKIVKKYNLPYKYVGDGSFLIGRKNPDFVNTNNEKIAIEVYARYFKLKHKESIEEWKKDRAKVFKEYGWRTIYFDAMQVNEQSILNKLT